MTKLKLSLTLLFIFLLSNTSYSQLINNDRKSCDGLRCIKVLATGEILGFPLNMSMGEISSIVEKDLNDRNIKFDKSKGIFAEIISKEFKFPQGVSIYLPSDWVQIPTDIINKKIEEMQRLSPNSKSSIPDFAFQLKDSPWFSYPYIMIKFMNTGKVQGEELAKVLRMKKIKESTAADVIKELPTLISSIKIGESYYDEESKIIWNQETSTTDVGVLRAVVAIILTEKGIINLAEYTKEEDFTKYSYLFEEIPKNVLLSDELRYKSGIAMSPVSRGMDWGKILTKTFMGGLIGAIIGGIWGLFFKKKRYNRES